MKPHYKLNIDGTRIPMPPFIDDKYEFSPEFMERQFINAYRRLSDGTKNSFSSMFAVAAGLPVVFTNPDPKRLEHVAANKRNGITGPAACPPLKLTPKKTKPASNWDGEERRKVDRRGSPAARTAHGSKA